MSKRNHNLTPPKIVAYGRSRQKPTSTHHHEKVHLNEVTKHVVATDDNVYKVPEAVILAQPCTTNLSTTVRRVESRGGAQRSRKFNVEDHRPRRKLPPRWP
ncbi:MAG: hypothetical protein CMJ77_02230 [Planctomycetaceae bacterium]|nr:hypothetical protein [Planctomycetaceae bacterium]